MEQQESSITVDANEAFTRTFNGEAIRVVPHDEDVWVTAEAVGVALEYPNPHKAVGNIFQRHRDELEEHSRILKLRINEDGVCKRQVTRLFNEEGVMIITMLSRQPKAAEFRRWAVQVLKAFRRGDLVVREPRDREQMHRLCLKEVSRGNVAAMDTLIQHFGYRPEFKREQLLALAALRGRNVSQMQMALSGGQGDG